MNFRIELVFDINFFSSSNYCILKMNNEPNETSTKDATHIFSPASANWNVPNMFSTKIERFANKNYLETVPVMMIFSIVK